jgi:hypothetical protein
MPTPVNHIGGEGKVTVNGTDMNIDKWSATESISDNKVTTTGDYDPATGRLYDRHLGGATSLAGSFEMPYDSANDPWPGSIRAGSIVTNLILTKSTGHVITCPLAFITSVAIDQGGTDGVFKYTISFSNQSTFTIT